MHSDIFTRCTYPLVQAPMAGVQDVRLALAACRAGIIGSLPAAMLAPDALYEAAQALAAGAQGAPFNLNFFAHTPPVPDETVQERWLDILAPYYRQWGIAPTQVAWEAGRRPFDAQALAVVQAVRPPVVSFHFGLPAQDLLAAVKATGAQVWASATTLAEALHLQARGADAVIAQGLEAGGHRGVFLPASLDRQLPLHELLAQCTAKLHVPIIAAGGIADAHDVHAAMRQGAHAVQAGSAFLLADEADTPDYHRAAIHAGGETALTNLFTGGHARGLRNRLMRELGDVRREAPPFPLATAALAPLRGAAEAQNCYDFSPLWAGTRAHLAQSLPAADIVAALAEGFAP